MICKLSTFENPFIDLDGTIRAVASIKPGLPKNKIFKIKIINALESNFVKASLEKGRKKQIHIIELN